MKGSKQLISRTLSTLMGNMERTGDPLGFKHPYWTEWVDGLNLPREGESLLLTGRMYQMLPYVVQTTRMANVAKPLLTRKGLGMMVAAGSRFAGEAIIRLKAKGEKEIKTRTEKILRGIVAALRRSECNPAYLYEFEPYSGVLLYDLGLGEQIRPHMKRVVDLLERHGVKELITVDPHTTFMLRDVYPKHLGAFHFQVRHYLEILSQGNGSLFKADKAALPEDLVIHDPCVMARSLGMVDQARKLLEKIGIRLLEPENTKGNTACCGGPIEYAFGNLSEEISTIRIRELAAVSKNILVMCPICLVNLARYEKSMGVRIFDMGEVLYAL